MTLDRSNHLFSLTPANWALSSTHRESLFSLSVICPYSRLAGSSSLIAIVARTCRILHIWWAWLFLTPLPACIYAYIYTYVCMGLLCPAPGVFRYQRCSRGSPVRSGPFRSVRSAVRYVYVPGLLSCNLANKLCNSSGNSSSTTDPTTQW